jgi:hypothetical protein
MDSRRAHRREGRRGRSGLDLVFVRLRFLFFAIASQLALCHVTLPRLIKYDPNRFTRQMHAFCLRLAGKSIEIGKYGRDGHLPAPILRGQCTSKATDNIAGRLGGLEGCRN